MVNQENSGGTRFNAGKPAMWWAVPMKGLRAVARVTMLGSKKYAPLDWAVGQSYSTLLDSASRHWIEVLTDGPLARDEESGLLHLAHAAWNILCLLHFIEQGRSDLDDVSKWRGVTTAMKHEVEQKSMSIEEIVDCPTPACGCDGYGSGLLPQMPQAPEGAE